VSVGIIGEKSFFGEDDALFQRSRKFSATARYTHTSISNSSDFVIPTATIIFFMVNFFLLLGLTQIYLWRRKKIS